MKNRSELREIIMKIIYQVNILEDANLEIYNNKANSSGGGIYSNTGNLYVNSESKIYDNQVNDTNQGASIFVTEYEGFFYLDYVDTYDIPYTEDIGL